MLGGKDVGFAVQNALRGVCGGLHRLLLEIEQLLARNDIALETSVFQDGETGYEIGAAVKVSIARFDRVRIVGRDAGELAHRHFLRRFRLSGVQRHVIDADRRSAELLRRVEV